MGEYLFFVCVCVCFTVNAQEAQGWNVWNCLNVKQELWPKSQVCSCSTMPSNFLTQAAGDF